MFYWLSLTYKVKPTLRFVFASQNLKVTQDCVFPAILLLPPTSDLSHILTHTACLMLAWSGNLVPTGYGTPAPRSPGISGTTRRSCFVHHID